MLNIVILVLSLLFSLPALGATDSLGNEGNFVGGGSGFKIDPGQTALICQPNLLAAAASEGIGNGVECVRFINNGNSSINNLLPLADVSSFLSFAKHFASGIDSKGACQVAGNPWGGWQGEPTTDCGIHPFEQTRTCYASAAYCNDTCSSPSTETRMLSIDNGECETCNSDIYLAPNGGSKEAFAAQCPVGEFFTATNCEGDGIQVPCSQEPACDADIYLAPDGSPWEVFAAQCPIGESFMSTNCEDDEKERDCTQEPVCDADSFSNYQSNTLQVFPNSEYYYHWINDCGEYKTQYVADVLYGVCVVTAVDVYCPDLPVDQQTHINTITYPAPKPAACPAGSTSCYQY